MNSTRNRTLLSNKSWVGHHDGLEPCITWMQHGAAWLGVWMSEVGKSVLTSKPTCHSLSPGLCVSLSFLGSASYACQREVSLETWEGYPASARFSSFILVTDNHCRKTDADPRLEATGLHSSASCFQGLELRASRVQFSNSEPPVMAC